MRIKFILVLIALVAGLSHCASYDFSRREVQQGNLLPNSKIEQLKIGMTKEAVATLMGTSLLNPIFNENRWDYAYTKRRGGSIVESRKLSLYFQNDHLMQIELG